MRKPQVLSPDGWAWRMFAAAAAFAGLPYLGGCEAGGSYHAKFTDHDPSVRLWAVHHAGDTKDQAAVPYLIDRLSDSDKTVRLFAIMALEKITGTRRGYVVYAPAEEREKAIEEWRRWQASRQKLSPATQPGKESHAPAPE